MVNNPRREKRGPLPGAASRKVCNYDVSKQYTTRPRLTRDKPSA